LEQLSLHVEIYYSVRIVQDHRAEAYDDCNCEGVDEKDEDCQEGEDCHCDDERDYEEADVVDVVEDASSLCKNNCI